MSATHLHVEIVTPEGTLYSGSAQAVTLPGGACSLPGAGQSRADHLDARAWAAADSRCRWQ